ncbi:MAG: hypothetical protein Q8Q09_15480 [Deltaproteobacteria bacterium]|nr:hypothetical protein [Deltaproteobacteria bacterium]
MITPRWSLAVLLTSMAACGAPAPATPENTPVNPGDPGGGVTPAAPSTPDPTCAPVTLDATRYLRQLSLDLRGRPPTDEELDAVQTAGQVPDAMIDAMLASREFLQRAKDWHASLLWPTLDGYRISTTDLTGFDPNMTTGAAGGTFSPDPELLSDEGRARHPNAVVAIRYNGTGDRQLRGGTGFTGCDGRRGAPYEYPAPAARGATQPTYRITVSDGTTVTRPYYDNDGAPLPLYDGNHCPNYCSSVTQTPNTDGLRLRAIRPGICQVIAPSGAGSIVSADFGRMAMVGVATTGTVPAAWTSPAPTLSPMGCRAAGDICACPNAGGAVTTTATQFTITTPPTGFSTEALDPPGQAVGGTMRAAACPPWQPFRVTNTCDNTPYTGPDEAFKIRREGTRTVSNWYWAEAQSMRVCAYDSQSAENSARNGQSCATPYSGRRDTSCGCGPRGVYCMPAIGVSANTDLVSLTQARVRGALNDEPLEIVRSVIERGENYFNIFTTRRSFINGPLRHLYENQVGSVQGIELSAPAPMNTMPAAPFADDTPREYIRGAEHSGVLTTAAYLGRFPTWRARVAQFRNSFMCKPFTPGTDRVPAPSDPCTREPNLATRCGCQNCHAAIEPMTAYFARWAERSTRFLSAAEFPAYDANCAMCALRGIGCTTRCRQQYVTDTVDADGARFAGTLRGFLYRRPDEMSRVDEGPAGLVSAAAASGELQSCTVRTVWRQLLNRSMSESEQRALLPNFVTGFSQANYNYRALVRAVVTSPTYRRVD